MDRTSSALPMTFEYIYIYTLSMFRTRRRNNPLLMTMNLCFFPLRGIPCINFFFHSLTRLDFLLKYRDISPTLVIYPSHIRSFLPVRSFRSSIFFDEKVLVSRAGVVNRSITVKALIIVDTN